VRAGAGRKPAWRHVTRHRGLPSPRPERVDGIPAQRACYRIPVAAVRGGEPAHFDQFSMASASTRRLTVAARTQLNVVLPSRHRRSVRVPRPLWCVQCRRRGRIAAGSSRASLRPSSSRTAKVSPPASAAKVPEVCRRSSDRPWGMQAREWSLRHVVCFALVVRASSAVRSGGCGTANLGTS
jgi:hypothetical protein